MQHSYHCNVSTPSYCLLQVIMANDAEQQQQQPQQRPGILRVGTAGWTKASWRGPFLPPGVKSSGDAMLDAYQQHFRTVENNGTCHSTPSRETVLKWKARCGRDFLMAPKMAKHVTHAGGEQQQPQTAASLDALRIFADNLAALGEHLGPILLQFPRTRQLTAEQVRAMALVVENSRLPKDVKIAVELRNSTAIQDDDLLQELRRLQWCLVAHPNSIGRGTVIAEHRGEQSKPDYEPEPLQQSWPLTAGSWMYVRLHGTNDEHTGRYSEDELRRQAVPAIVAWLRRGIDVYAYLLNDDDEAAMPQNAKSLEFMCYQELGTSVPAAPKQVKSIASFFTKKTPVTEGNAGTKRKASTSQNEVKKDTKKGAK